MIDIHSHLLYGLDDGPASFEVSLKMAVAAQANGTTDIVATPHANHRYHYHTEVVAERVQALQTAVGPGLRIHRGCDFHLSVENLADAMREPARYSINGLRFLLVEFPDTSSLPGVESIFAKLSAIGLTPIVTHPERNQHLIKDTARLRRWVESGIPLQITAQSLTGEFGEDKARWCRRMLIDGLVHFVASDAHDLERRPPRLDLARDLLLAEFGEEYCELIFETHPRCVLEGTELEIRPVPPARKKKRLWGLL